MTLKFPTSHLPSFYDTITTFSRNKSLKKMEDSYLLKQALRDESDNILTLWEVFTKNRAELPRYLQDPKKQALAYLLGWHLPNIFRTSMLLERAFSRVRFDNVYDPKKNTHVLDLGCGTGAVGSEVVRYLKDKGHKNLSLSLYDSRGAFLDMARHYNSKLHPDVALSTIKGDIQDKLTIQNIKKYFDVENDQIIVVFGYVWNEISKNKRAVEKILKTLEILISEQANISVLVLEPGNEEQSFEAMKLRDFFVHVGLQVGYPCGGNFYCPLLEEQKDWCFSTEIISKPNELKMIDRTLGINHAKIHSSAYFFYSLKDGVKAPASDKKIAIGFPVTDKKNNLYEVLVCSKSGVEKVPPTQTTIRLRGLELKN